MRRKKLTILITTAAIAAAGAGAAIGASGSDEAKQAENEILANAAQQLDTTPDALRDALGEALDAQLDQAVADGRLTQAQADAMKQRRQESGTVLGFGPGGPGGPGRHGPGGPGFGHRMGGGPLDGVADALGISERKLFRQLRSGKTLAQIAEAQGKDVAEVKAAATAAAKKRLDAAVADEEITRAQADEMLEHLREQLDDLAENGLPQGPRFGPRGHHGPPGVR